MINALEDYIWRSLPEYGDFVTNPNLEKKADREGTILPYYGNTTVFLLDEATKEQLKLLQEELYQGAGEMLAQRLVPDTFHMTLHDLVNASVKDAQLEERMEQAAREARGILDGWHEQAVGKEGTGQVAAKEGTGQMHMENGRPLRMRTTWMFNMVSTSIVLGLAPADEYSWQKLDEMYCALEQVVTLGYGMTPHITLAYFKPGVYGPEQVQKLKDVLRKVELEVTLRMGDLVLQEFTDMNHYETIK